MSGKPSFEPLVEDIKDDFDRVAFTVHDLGERWVIVPLGAALLPLADQEVILAPWIESSFVEETPENLVARQVSAPVITRVKVEAQGFDSFRLCPDGRWAEVPVIRDCEATHFALWRADGTLLFVLEAWLGSVPAESTVRWVG